MTNNCRSAKLKGILCRRRLLGPWLKFGKKKHVKFVEPESMTHSGRRQLKDKWRKYVLEQFKVLQKLKREKMQASRNNKSGYAWSGPHGDVRENPWPSTSSNSFGLDDSSLEQLLSYEVPESDYNRRMKNGRSGSNFKSYGWANMKKRRVGKPRSRTEHGKIKNGRAVLMPDHRHDCGDDPSPSTSKDHYCVHTCRSCQCDNTDDNAYPEMTTMEHHGEDLGDVGQEETTKDCSCSEMEPPPCTHSQKPYSKRQDPHTQSSKLDDPASSGYHYQHCDRYARPSSKRPLNAFMVFSQRCRQEFKQRKIDTSNVIAVSQHLGNIWRHLSKKDRKSFYKEAERQRKLFYDKKSQQRHKEIHQAAYKDQRDEEDEDEDCGDEDKRPLNSFALFVRDHIHLYQGCGQGHTGRRALKKCARKWRNLKNCQKQNYIRKADRAREKYLDRKRRGSCFEQNNTESHQLQFPTTKTDCQPTMPCQNWTPCTTTEGCPQTDSGCPQNISSVTSIITHEFQSYNSVKTAECRASPLSRIRSARLAASPVSATAFRTSVMTLEGWPSALFVKTLPEESPATARNLQPLVLSEDGQSSAFSGNTQDWLTLATRMNFQAAAERTANVQPSTSSGTDRDDPSIKAVSVRDCLSTLPGEGRPLGTSRDIMSASSGLSRDCWRALPMTTLHSESSTSRVSNKDCSSASLVTSVEGQPAWPVTRADSHGQPTHIPMKVDSHPTEPLPQAHLVFTFPFTDGESASQVLPIKETPPLPTESVPEVQKGKYTEVNSQSSLVGKCIDGDSQISVAGQIEKLRKQMSRNNNKRFTDSSDVDSVTRLTCQRSNIPSLSNRSSLPSKYLYPRCPYSSRCPYSRMCPYSRKCPGLECLRSMDPTSSSRRRHGSPSSAHVSPTEQYEKCVSSTARTPTDGSIASTSSLRRNQSSHNIAGEAKSGNRRLHGGSSEESSEPDNCRETSRQGRKPSRRKKKKKRPRYVSKGLDKRVRWRDELKRWGPCSVQDPITNVLCDEDIAYELAKLSASHASLSSTSNSSTQPQSCSNDHSCLFCLPSRKSHSCCILPSTSLEQPSPAFHMCSMHSPPVPPPSRRCSCTCFGATCCHIYPSDICSCCRVSAYTKPSLAPNPCTPTTQTAYVDSQYDQENAYTKPSLAPNPCTPTTQKAYMASPYGQEIAYTKPSLAPNPCTPTAQNTYMASPYGQENVFKPIPTDTFPTKNKCNRCKEKESSYKPALGSQQDSSSLGAHTIKRSLSCGCVDDCSDSIEAAVLRAHLNRLQTLMDNESASDMSALSLCSQCIPYVSPNSVQCPCCNMSSSAPYRCCPDTPTPTPTASVCPAISPPNSPTPTLCGSGLYVYFDKDKMPCGCVLVDPSKSTGSTNYSTDDAQNVTCTRCRRTGEVDFSHSAKTGLTDSASSIEISKKRTPKNRSLNRSPYRNTEKWIKSSWNKRNTQTSARQSARFTGKCKANWVRSNFDDKNNQKPARQSMTFTCTCVKCTTPQDGAVPGGVQSRYYKEKTRMHQVIHAERKRKPAISTTNSKCPRNHEAKALPRQEYRTVTRRGNSDFQPVISNSYRSSGRNKYSKDDVLWRDYWQLQNSFQRIPERALSFSANSGSELSLHTEWSFEDVDKLRIPRAISLEAEVSDSSLSFALGDSMLDLLHYLSSDGDDSTSCTKLVRSLYDESSRQRPELHSTKLKPSRYF